MSISVVIIALNEEKNISACLESVKWADEIIVVDSFSHDKTAELAEKFGARVFQAEWQGYGRQKNYALGKAAMDWILSLDADERITPELAEEIQAVIQNPEYLPPALQEGLPPAGGGHPPPALPEQNAECRSSAAGLLPVCCQGLSQIDGYQICRKAYFLGKWIRHSGWYPDYCLRLFRRGRGVFAEKQVHEYVELTGSMGRLKGTMLHYTDDNLKHYLDKLQRYTTLAADELKARGKKASLSDLITRPLFIFFKMYILKKGFLDGMHGFILAVLSSFYVFVKYAKLWEVTANLDEKGKQ